LEFCVEIANDDDWGDEDNVKKPEPLGTYICVADYIPESNDFLTLELDAYVYVYKKEVPGKPGVYI
jgi:hypothetical protein